MSQKQNLTAVIYSRSGNVLAAANNSYEKTSPFQAAIAKKVGLPDKVFGHAECRAISALHYSHKPYSIFVSRKMRKGGFGNSFPCPVCFEAIKQSGIKKIYFTNEEGQIQMEKVQ